MSDLSQLGPERWNRSPILISSEPSGLPFIPPASPPPDVKFEIAEIDEPLNPFVPEPDEPLDPEVDRSSLNRGEHLPPLGREGYLPLDPEVHLSPLDPRTPKANTHFDNYIPAGVLGKTRSTSRYPDCEIRLLETHEWIRTRFLVDSRNVQIFVLPRAEKVRDQSGKTLKFKALRYALKTVMSMVDSSSEAWNGLVDARFDLLANSQPDSEEESLYYIYNTLQEPKPDLDQVTDPISWRVMDELLTNSVRNLKTSLHPFQRESAAFMIQREVQPALALDPRFQPLRGPTGLEFYYNKESGSILRDKILYPEACGGILAESMGCGKTLISLAVILATRGHFPKIPVEYQKLENPVRQKTGTLLQMTAAAAGRFSLPWKEYIDQKRACGQYLINCEKACETYRGSYIIPAKENARSRSMYVQLPEEIRLSSGTVVIVPDNLVDHWEREIATHTSNLNVLVLRNSTPETPSADELLEFDIVLLTKARCVRENPSRGKRPDSPLFNLHWLRVIVDEGHDLSSRVTNLSHLLGKLKFERRWMISGTPLSELYGVELSIASREVNIDDPVSSDEDASLQFHKKTGNAVDTEIKNVSKLGDMVHYFFNLKPWANNPEDWLRYTRAVGEDGIRRKSPSLRAILQGLVVRHRYETVKKEITLPPLYNKVIYLEPTFYDRLYINMFLFTLAVNAITSEREGPDYMFNGKKTGKKNRLMELIQNLRLAGFWWAGDDNVQSTVDIALEYLQNNEEKMTAADVNQLKQGIEIARKAINSTGWNGFKNMHELGVFVRNFPENARNMWALDPTDADREPLLMGMTQALRAQQFVMKNMGRIDPTAGFAGEGIKVRQGLLKHQTARSAYSGAQGPMNPKESTPPKRKGKQSFEKNLPQTFEQTKLEGVASAKLRYLLEQVLEFQKTEKIIIFYEHDNVASWVEQGLQLIGVKFRTYASAVSMGYNTKSENLAAFRQTDEVRVLLMNVKQAAHGLHIPEASRMYIVNPIWERNVESQAIKRAHRIGQKRPVYVETLVLGNTLEHRMLHRSKNMTSEETKNAGKNPVDDKTMSEIIQNEPFLPMPDDEASAGMAPLAQPIVLFEPDNVVRAPGPPRSRPLRSAPSPWNPPRGVEPNADSNSVDVQGQPPPKRPRFAEQSQVISVGEAPAPQQPVLGVNSASGAGVAVWPWPTSVANPAAVNWDGFGASDPVQFVPMGSVVDSTGNGVDTRASLFGPFGP
ncbi:hypothetical protein DTO013E5_4605 [Penicillium roqueforti]|nr:uncharacterized protein LCP9604111_3773 [Penicillium roqueforti]KAF9250257.1 hypothetical protein LCP9604111_3773 [Penicillium roqueforti]KAI1832667.1 hypothetical protein CBS147337_6517 [Penicillium roqueforti]KAI2676357.1 hypothetical protein LCP963914a_8319 [Penicillium roqueforti]KAI2679707.1 hypothetical protein CBS147355_4189 [Penicillium roqueforti]KAI2700895.1 hypothetical protein CBS147372_4965 [Penicillium roqueforti]